jgi:hypothetical protein
MADLIRSAIRRSHNWERPLRARVTPPPIADFTPMSVRRVMELSPITP